MSRNNNRYDDSWVGWVFATGREIECFIGYAAFKRQGGWFEKFINQEAFHKAYAINPKLAFDTNSLNYCLIIWRWYEYRIFI
ncbi:hypothetical protein CS542_07595 [Pedobacter sp. IW39]|nr:hypothetical protein CS542_07595 [Pedobacter sp. IW39]